MKKVRNLLLLAVILYIPIRSNAWGVVGHKLVAKIAYTQISPAVKDSLKYYLEQTTIEEASVWMDEIKADASNDSLKPFHYFDMDKGEKYNPDSTNNIIGELNRVIRELKDRGKYSKEHIAVDIKILIHLVGDLHQPLHTGYKNDKGGNAISVFFAANGSNLHRVWDTDILEGYILNEPTTWASTSKYSKEELAAIKKTDVVGWMNESRSKLDIVYDFTGQDISGKYIKLAVPVIEERLLFGGLRLGKLLHDIFRA